MDLLVAFIEWDPKLNPGDLLVGAGTLGLAAVTAWLAWQTKSDVDQARRGVELAQESLEAQDRPFVVGAPQDERIALEFAPDEFVTKHVYFYLDLLNAGRGPAIVTDVQLHIGDKQLLEPLTNHYAVPAGATRAANCRAPRAPAELPPSRWEPYDGLLTIYYGDAGGAEYMTRSRVQVISTRVYCASFARVAADDAGRDMYVGR